MDSSEIKEVIQLYFDASYEGNGEKMDRVFHDAAHIYGHEKDGSFRDQPKRAFVEHVGSAGQGGQDPGYPRQNEILSIDFTGENTAVARVKLRVRDTLFTDVLSFMRLDGKWGVIAKVLSGVAIS